MLIFPPIPWSPGCKEQVPVHLAGIPEESFLGPAVRHRLILAPEMLGCSCPWGQLSTPSPFSTPHPPGSQGRGPILALGLRTQPTHVISEWLDLGLNPRHRVSWEVEGGVLPWVSLSPAPRLCPVMDGRCRVCGSLTQPLPLGLDSF